MSNADCRRQTTLLVARPRPLRTAKLPLNFSASDVCSERGDVLHTHKTGSHMATVLQFIRNKSDFDDEATRLIGEAFDAACKGLRDTGQPALVREIIAKRIIEAAKKGECDPARLRAAGLAALGYDREAI
jgi:hypothetical protein